jgi:hypothetical protein
MLAWAAFLGVFAYAVFYRLSLAREDRLHGKPRGSGHHDVADGLEVGERIKRGRNRCESSCNEQ